MKQKQTQIKANPPKQKKQSTLPIMIEWKNSGNSTHTDTYRFKDSKMFSRQSRDYECSTW